MSSKLARQRRSAARRKIDIAFLSVQSDLRSHEWRRNAANIFDERANEHNGAVELVSFA